MNKRELSLPGDLLFYKVHRSTGIFGKTIGFFEKLWGSGKGNYYHVSILDSTLDFQYESTFPKSKRSVVNWEDPELEVWRIMSLTELNIAEMLVWSSQHVGEWYGLGKSLSAFVRSRRLQVCSEYVLKAVKNGRFDLYPNQTDPLIAPDELINHPLICPVAI